jgi:hypothetical protein
MTGTDCVIDWYMQTITPLNGPRSAMTVYPLNAVPTIIRETCLCALCAGILVVIGYVGEFAQRRTGVRRRCAYGQRQADCRGGKKA